MHICKPAGLCDGILTHACACKFFVISCKGSDASLLLIRQNPQTISFYVNVIL